MIVASAYRATMITPLLPGMSSRRVSEGAESGLRVSEAGQRASRQADIPPCPSQRAAADTADGQGNKVRQPHQSSDNSKKRAPPGVREG
jgi:hypothetical protein